MLLHFPAFDTLVQMRGKIGRDSREKPAHRLAGIRASCHEWQNLSKTPRVLARIWLTRKAEADPISCNADLVGWRIG